MKKKVLLCGIVLIGLLGIPTISNAQASRITKEVIKSVGKAVSKNKKGVSDAVKKTTQKATKSSSRTEKTARPITVSCSSCNGNGYTTKWNSYSQSYVRARCNKCNGTGRVTRVVRY